MQKDNLFTRMVRPTTLAVSLIIFFILMIMDGNFGEFTVRDIYLKIFETLLTTMVVFYFSSRGIEKAVKSYSDSRIKQENLKDKTIMKIQEDGD